MKNSSPKILFFCTFQSNDQNEYSPFWQDPFYQNFREASSAELADLFRPLAPHGMETIDVRGGEPLIRQDLPEILHVVREYGWKIRLRTNGILFEERAEELRNCVDEFSLLLYHPLPDIHDRILGIPGHQPFLKGLEKAQKESIPARILYPVTRETITHLPEAVELSEKYHLPLHLEPHYLSADLVGFQKDSLLSLGYFARRKNVVLSAKIQKQLERDREHWDRKFCKAGEYVITIAPDGTMLTPCVYARDEKGTAGNLNACAACSDWSYLAPSLRTRWGRFHERIAVS